MKKKSQNNVQEKQVVRQEKETFNLKLNEAELKQAFRKLLNSK